MHDELFAHRRHALERHLTKVIQGQVRFDLPTRRLYSTDASIYQIEPVGVVLPRTAADVQAAVRVAAEHHIPMVPRGGGTSLSGQAIGPGVVIDCSKYLNHILDIDPAARTARVQPGVVLEQFNQALAAHGLQFGPDVSTANRATLGGMIGNNSAGAHSILYGKTVDHVRRMETVLADGTPASFGRLALRELETRAGGAGREAAILRTLDQTVRRNHLEIRQRFPRVLRRVSGYNLDLMADGWEAGEVNLASLLVGSEGTLAFLTEAEVAVVPRHRHRGLLVPHFATMPAALDALGACLELQPSAVEMMDQMILDLARENLALRRQMSGIQGRPAAVLMVEFTSDDRLEVQDRLDKLYRRLDRAGGVTALVRAEEAATREPLWRLRESGLPLLMGLPGDRKPVAFVEDTAVAPERLPEFTQRFHDLITRHGTHGAFYGHASVGCLHIRPVLNLKDAADVATMRQISEEVADLVLEFGGSLSGEHGDGLARSEWLRKMFGDEVYEAFRRIKAAFDPEGLMNPGKIVDAPPMTENLRFGPNYHTVEPTTVLDFARHGGMAGHVELCSGTGVCRKLHGGAMCPSFRATRDEKDNTRGRANALRLALAGERPLDELRSEWVHDVLDLCLSCKACKSECPSNVDMARLKAEADRLYYETHYRPLAHRMIRRLPTVLRLGAKLAPAANWLNARRVVRWLMEKVAGIDRRRSLPPLRFDHFRRWFSRRRPGPGAGAAGRVLLFDDCFTTYSEPAIGMAAIAVLEAAGYAVELVRPVCCGRPMISKGLLTDARKLVAEQAPSLAERIADGTPILGLEPSCLLTLSDEWPQLAPGPATEQIARAARLADAWLGEQVQQGRCAVKLDRRAEPCVVHGHCHQKALVGVGSTVEALRLIPGLDVNPLDTGCCGMAGFFGYEHEHYDLSVKVAEVSLLPHLTQHQDAIVVAPGTSCRHQIKDVTGRHAVHPMELLAAQLQADAAQ
jgi:FAD/FMN-containing dehydrogenase/Fe-S oxidoreductase